MQFARRAPEALKTDLQQLERPIYGLRETSIEYVTPESGNGAQIDRCFKNFYSKMLNKNNELRNLFIKHDPSLYPLRPYHVTLEKFILDMGKQSKQLLKKHLDIFEQFITTVNIDRTKYILNLRKPFLKFLGLFNKFSFDPDCPIL